jgi:hypothetical protein
VQEETAGSSFLSASWIVAASEQAEDERMLVQALRQAGAIQVLQKLANTALKMNRASFKPPFQSFAHGSADQAQY